MAMKRKIAKLFAPRKFEIVEEPLGSPKPNEILIRILAVGLCHSEMPTYLGKSAIAVREDGSYFKNEDLKYPVEMGHEPVGLVEAVGAEVKNFKEGDHISSPVTSSFASPISIQIPTTAILAKIPSPIKESRYCLAEPSGCTPMDMQVGIYGKQPEVINGASELLEKIFGEKGKHVRCALGTSSLPRDITVELEMIVKVRE